jgi:hypothetical protein
MVCQWTCGSPRLSIFKVKNPPLVVCFLVWGHIACLGEIRGEDVANPLKGNAGCRTRVLAAGYHGVAATAHRRRCGRHRARVNRLRSLRHRTSGHAVLSRRRRTANGRESRSRARAGCDIAGKASGPAGLLGGGLGIAGDMAIKPGVDEPLEALTLALRGSNSRGAVLGEHGVELGCREAGGRHSSGYRAGGAGGGTFRFQNAKRRL